MVIHIGHGSRRMGNSRASSGTCKVQDQFGLHETLSQTTATQKNKNGLKTVCILQRVSNNVNGS